LALRISSDRVRSQPFGRIFGAGNDSLGDKPVRFIAGFTIQMRSKNHET
jgi:hypothetical protein